MKLKLSESNECKPVITPDDLPEVRTTCHMSPICQRCQRCVQHCTCPPPELRAKFGSSKVGKR